MIRPQHPHEAKSVPEFYHRVLAGRVPPLAQGRFHAQHSLHLALSGNTHRLVLRLHVIRLCQQVNRKNEMRRLIGFVVLAIFATCPERAPALANPASVFCVQSGGKSEIRKGPRGQYGVCRLPDGRVVEEWAYFRQMKGKAGRR
jgi:putative hemolysin